MLVDVEQGNHPWLGGFERVLDAWRTQGVVLERYDFRNNPAWLTEAGTGRAISIDELARRTAGLPAVVVSRSLDPDVREGPARWLEALPAWPTCAWIDPNPRHAADLPPARRRAVRRIETEGLRRFRLTDGGVVSAAGWLASEGERVAADNGPPLPSLEAVDARVTDALRRWALAGALVPDPTWDQLEAIRRRFPELWKVLPDARYLQLLLEWVERDTGRLPELDGGRGLDIPEEAQDRWIRRERQIGGDFESRVHALLLEQLAGTEPSGELQRQRWKLKQSMHQAILEPERPRNCSSGCSARPSVRRHGDGSLRSLNVKRVSVATRRRAVGSHRWRAKCSQWGLRVDAA